jgi:hypothetical protein
MATAQYELPTLAESQASAEVVVNNALNLIDGLMNLSVLDRDLATPPGSPANGDAYLVATAGTGAWSGKDGQIAIYADGWVFAPVKFGLIMYVEDENALLIRRAAGTWGTITVT